MAYAIFAARPHSHPFQERKVVLQEPCKVGRAVAKCKTSQNNLIFDCKVLSRSHAIVWYENGKFLIKDTNSSNGTYVNSVQVGRNGEDPEAVELWSRDIVQFGVDVTENSKKVTHGCIIAVVTLINPDGTEALRDPVKPTGRVLPLMDGEQKLKTKELWQLSKYIQDAMNREQLLEQKLATMQRMIADSSTATDDAFQSFVKEDQLLSRLDMLENELDVVTKDISEDDSRKLLITFQEDKENYELKAKESIQRLIDEKSETLRKLADVQRSLSYSEDECAHLKSLYEKSEEDVKHLMDRNEQLLKEMQKSRNELETVESEHKLYKDETVEERNKLKIQQEETEKRASTLAVKVESLQAECDFTKQQLSAMKEKLEKHQNEIAKRPDEENQEKIDHDISVQSARFSHACNSFLLEIKRNLLEMKKHLKILSPRSSDEETDEDDRQSSGIFSVEGEPDLAASLEHFSHLSREINGELIHMSENMEKMDIDEERELRHQLQSAEAEVFKVQLQIDELHENLLLEQKTSLKYKKLAKEFEDRLKELQEKMDKNEKMEQERLSDYQRHRERIVDEVLSETAVHQLESENTTIEEVDSPQAQKEAFFEQSTSSDGATVIGAEDENDGRDTIRAKQAPKSAQHQDIQTTYLLFALVAVVVAIGAAYLLGVIKVSLGNSSGILRELYELLF